MITSPSGYNYNDESDVDDGAPFAGAHRCDGITKGGTRCRRWVPRQYTHCPWHMAKPSPDVVRQRLVRQRDEAWNDLVDASKRQGWQSERHWLYAMASAGARLLKIERQLARLAPRPPITDKEAV